MHRWYGVVLIAVALAACDQAQEERAATAASEAVHEANQALRQAESVAREGTREAGRMLAQGGITAKVKTALLADETVPGTRIDVDTQDAVVTLSGSLATQAQIDRAVTIARAVEGVQSVENRLTLTAPPG